MYEHHVSDFDEGQRLDKYVHKLLPQATNGFLYKMFRKKNIVLNGKKISGDERLAAGDVLTLYFSDETLQKFMGNSYKTADFAGNLADTGKNSATSGDSRGNDARNHAGKHTNARKNVTAATPVVLYENRHVLLANKPIGMLTQKAKQDDDSLNDWLLCYLKEKGDVTAESLRTFVPSACNRLDRNTGGIVLCAKTLPGARLLGELLRNRTLRKFYKLVAYGHFPEEMLAEHMLVKDETVNTVRILPKTTKEGQLISTHYAPLRYDGEKTLIEAELLTGKPHQIRAQLAYMGYPIIGDPKYGDAAVNRRFRKEYGVQSQLLFACRVTFPELETPFDDLRGRTFEAPLPEAFLHLS